VRQGKQQRHQAGVLHAVNRDARPKGPRSAHLQLLTSSSDHGRELSKFARYVASTLHSIRVSTPFTSIPSRHKAQDGRLVPASAPISAHAVYRPHDARPTPYSITPLQAGTGRPLGHDICLACGVLHPHCGNAWFHASSNVQSVWLALESVPIPHQGVCRPIARDRDHFLASTGRSAQGNPANHSGGHHSMVDGAKADAH